MATALNLVVALVTVANGDITRSVPRNGACLCFNGNSVNIRSAACGQTVIGSANAGQCFTYAGSNIRCTLNSRSYQFFKINYNGNQQGWAAGVYLNLESDSRCVTSGARPAASPASTGNDYTCQVTDEGKRVHEQGYATEYDCVDTRCRNTCKGGQCVAYVKCRCTKNGKYPPNTPYWRPGEKVKTADGKCNRNIAANTAIATFGSNGRYNAHAAVFIRCQDDYTVRVYHQYCGRSVGYSNYSRSHQYFRDFATIRNSSDDGPSSKSCRSETSGPTTCSASVPGCK